MRLLVTGYGPFSGFDTNPSQAIAERVAEGLGAELGVLEVSFQAVDRFLEDPVWGRVDAALLLGVAGGRHRPRIERLAYNEIGPHPDVAGENREGPIAPGAPMVLGQTLVRLGRSVRPLGWSLDPGRYLCNYLMYGALHRHPGVASAFLHVVPEARMPLGAQADAIVGVFRHERPLLPGDTLWR